MPTFFAHSERRKTIQYCECCLVSKPVECSFPFLRLSSYLGGSEVFLPKPQRAGNFASPFIEVGQA
jgi:hypothetical protein